MEQKYYVWNVTDNAYDFSMISYDILTKNILRQGWGKDGMDIRKSYEEYAKAWSKAGWGDEDPKPKYDRLRRILGIQRGDIIVVRGFVPGYEYYVVGGVSLCECTETYSFSVMKNRDDFGHCIGVKILKSFEGFGSDTKLGNTIRGYRESVMQVTNENTLTVLATLKDNDECVRKLKGWI